MPVEVAMARHDDIVHFLISMGAKYNLPVQHAIARSWGNSGFVTLRDEVAHALCAADEVLALPFDTMATVEPLPSSLAPSDFDTWKTYVGQLRDDLAALSVINRDVANSNDRKQALAFKPYIDEIRALFESRGAKTWNELYPDNLAPPDAGKNRTTFAQRAYQNATKSALIPGYCRNGSVPVPTHLTTLYDDLFEACWIGDNQRIRRLCLPDDAAADQKELLQITVTAVTDTQSYGVFL